MNEDIKRELQAVNQLGVQLAKRFILEKVLVLMVAISAILFSFKIFDSMIYIPIELLILVIVMRFVKRTQKNFQTAIYEKCDPYLQFVIVDHYRKNWRIMPKRLKDQLLIAMAQCMVLAGEPQEAISILNKIEKPSQLKMVYRSIYYNNLLNAYGQFCWEQKRVHLVGEIKELRSHCSPKDAMYLDVILRLEELNVRREALDLEFVEDYFKNNPPQHLFQKVGMHYNLAIILMKKGKREEAKQSIDFVMQNGNKLYYKKELEKRIQRV